MFICGINCLQDRHLWFIIYLPPTMTEWRMLSFLPISITPGNRLYRSPCDVVAERFQWETQWLHAYPHLMWYCGYNLLITTAADEILLFFFLFFRKKNGFLIRWFTWTFKWVLFSLKNKSATNLLSIWVGISFYFCTKTYFVDTHCY